jgi:hypothetical protein
MMSERAQHQRKQSSFASTPVSSGVLQRTCACGNHTIAGGQCAECAKKKRGLQRKLVIGATNDPLEQEADRVAEQVTAAPPNSAVNAIPPRAQRFIGASTDGANTAPASVDRVLASSGRPLEPAIRQGMEQRFGYDFSQVRVHADSAAAQSAQDVNAHAYTVGRNIVFGARFVPGTQEGRRLLAHELTHVLQQSSSNGPSRLPLQRAPDMTGYGAGAVRRGSTLPYREAKELAECIRIMGESSADYCREEVLHEHRDPPTALPRPSSPGAPTRGKTMRIKSLDQARGCGYTVVYSNPREVDCDTVFKNQTGKSPPDPLCGVSLVYDITSVSATGSKCPKLDGLKLSEVIKGDQGCTPSGFVWPAPNPCVIGAGGQISGCTDTFTVCGPTRNLQGNGCTEIVDQEIEVGGQLVEEHEIVFDLKKSGKSCTGKVTRN